MVWDINAIENPTRRPKIWQVVGLARVIQALADIVNFRGDPLQFNWLYRPDSPTKFTAGLITGVSSWPQTCGISVDTLKLLESWLNIQGSLWGSHRACAKILWKLLTNREFPVNFGEIFSPTFCSRKRDFYIWDPSSPKSWIPLEQPWPTFLHML